jgi:hypothetical protein
MHSFGRADAQVRVNHVSANQLSPFHCGYLRVCSTFRGFADSVQRLEMSSVLLDVDFFRVEA